MDKPEALLLAEVMSLAFPGNLGIDKAAAELRRLSAVEAQRDALLEALRQIVEQHGQWNNGIWAANIARAAIKTVEEGK